MPSHAIHLGSAWEPPSAERRAWTRRFGRPSGVEPGDRLVLRCEAVAEPAAWRAATLNDRGLEWQAVGIATLECDVTGRIADRNVLVMPQGQDEDDRAGQGPPGARLSLPPAWGRPSLVIVSD